MKLSPEYRPETLGCKLPPHHLPYMSQNFNPPICNRGEHSCERTLARTCGRYTDPVSVFMGSRVKCASGIGPRESCPYGTASRTAFREESAESPRPRVLIPVPLVTTRESATR